MLANIRRFFNGSAEKSGEINQFSTFFVLTIRSSNGWTKFKSRKTVRSLPKSSLRVDSFSKQGVDSIPGQQLIVSSTTNDI